MRSCAGQPGAADDGPQPPDAALVRQTLEGSQQAFEQLVQRYQPRLQAFVSRYANRNAHDAEDLVQETFLRAYRSLDRYDPRWAVSTWLFNIAQRLAISQYRKRKPLSNHAELAPAKASATEPAPDAGLIEREQRDGLWHIARKQLSEPHYAMLWLVYVEGMSIQQVSQVMQRTPVAVKVALHRARHRLAQHLSSDSSEPAVAARQATRFESHDQRSINP